MRIRGIDNTVMQHFRVDGTAKTAFPTQEEALVARSDPMRYMTYECGLCGKWHIGHLSGKKRRNKARKKRKGGGAAPL